MSEEEALDRQIWHAYRYCYVRQVTHIASHDLLIDEKWLDGERSKIRWSRDDAETAVAATIKAAAYLARRRRAIAGQFGHTIGFVLSAQGVEAEQYLACAKAIVPLMAPEDIFGLGGLCITGLLPDAILPSFSSIIQTVIPYLGAQGVRRVHIWGVCFPEALGQLFSLCRQYQMNVSTDSSGPQRKPMLGEWGYGNWRNNAYKRPPILESCKKGTCQPDTFCRGLERIRHLNYTRDYLAHFGDREPALCRLPVSLETEKSGGPYRQLSWIID